MIRTLRTYALIATTLVACRHDEDPVFPSAPPQPDAAPVVVAPPPAKPLPAPDPEIDAALAKILPASIDLVGEYREGSPVVAALSWVGYGKDPCWTPIATQAGRTFLAVDAARVTRVMLIAGNLTREQVVDCLPKAAAAAGNTIDVQLAGDLVSVGDPGKPDRLYLAWREGFTILGDVPSVRAILSAAAGHTRSTQPWTARLDHSPPGNVVVVSTDPIVATAFGVEATGFDIGFDDSRNMRTGHIVFHAATEDGASAIAKKIATKAIAWPSPPPAGSYGTFTTTVAGSDVTVAFSELTDEFQTFAKKLLRIPD